MDYLIKKSNGTAESLGGTVDRVKLPTQTGGDVVFVGDKRPVDLGEYVLKPATPGRNSYFDKGCAFVWRRRLGELS